MVHVTQTENEIKIIIKMNHLNNKRPDIVLMPTYIKFNNPPIFFEQHLTGEIDEVASSCRIFTHEVRITLIKKEKALWPTIFQKLSKEHLMQKRLEIVDQVIADTKKRDERTLERYEQKRRTEIEREVQRETEMRNKLQEFQEKACRNLINVTPKDTSIKVENKNKSTKVSNAAMKRANVAPSTNMPPSEKSVISATIPVVAAIRPTGKINVKFTNFMYSTPKRESQEGKPRPFLIEDNVPEKTKANATDST